MSTSENMMLLKYMQFTNTRMKNLIVIDQSLDNFNTQQGKRNFVTFQVFQPMTAQLGNVDCRSVQSLVERYSEGQHFDCTAICCVLKHQ